ncbi:hypothetical protein FACS1894147_07550 [Spirochaetia bacterium]|nr:hypothetical protein FACS1894147_07550 [Spirochaetia bacterium]
MDFAVTVNFQGGHCQRNDSNGADSRQKTSPIAEKIHHITAEKYRRINTDVVDKVEDREKIGPGIFGDRTDM